MSLPAVRDDLKIRQMEETKKCPYCGEEILAIAKKCKHCGEWLKEPELEPTEEPAQPEKLSMDEGNTLYCRHCSKPVSIDADVCPHCGNNDPFLFGAIRKEQKDYGSDKWGIYALIAVAIEITFSALGKSDGLLHWGLPQIGVFLVICILVILYLWNKRKTLREEHEKEMDGVFYKIGDSKAIKRWKAKVEQIID